MRSEMLRYRRGPTVTRLPHPQAKLPCRRCHPSTESSPYDQWPRVSHDYVDACTRVDPSSKSGDAIQSCGKGISLFSIRPMRKGRDTPRRLAARWVVSCWCSGTMEITFPASKFFTIERRRLC